MEITESALTAQYQRASSPAWFRRDLGVASPFMKGAGVAMVQKKTGADSCQNLSAVPPGASG